MVSINIACIFLAVFLRDEICASPAIKRSIRRLREVYPEIESSPETDGNQAQVCIVGDVVYGVDEIVPAEQPCLKCRCRPPGVQCETIRCAKKPGCKAVHRPNKCCPDYQCECNHEGHIYANGERLQSPPGGECQVCYCRGGEVQCANVSCYIRTDCEGKTVAGQCCPKYDNCPPKDLIQKSSAPEIVSNAPSKRSEITIHEIIPETKEITEASIVQSENDVTDSDHEPSEIREVYSDLTPTSTNDLTSKDVQPDSSDIQEVFHHPPQVLRIGDKLLFLKEGELVSEKDANTPAPVITIIGAEGLQRGEDSSEHDVVASTANDLDTRATESHILSLVRRKNPKPTTEPSSTETATTELPTTVAEDMTTEVTKKILSEVLEIRDNTTIPDTTQSQWLKNTTLVNPRAVLPDELLKQPAESDLEIDIEEEDPGEELDTRSTTLQPRSIETIEEMTSEESSKEATTALNHASLLSEDASVEDSESLDMLKLESSTQTDVEVFNESTTVQDESTLASDEVEMITLPTKVKRENSKQEEEDEIFRQLNAELAADTTEKIQSEQEEREESSQIFKELLEETSTPKPTRTLTKEEETLQRVSDAIAKLTLRGPMKNGLDTDLLKVISNFFSAQFKQDNK